MALQDTKLAQESRPHPRRPVLDDLALPQTNDVERVEGRLPPRDDCRKRASRKVIAMDWKLEVVTVPVSDAERARDFYADKVGFNVDIDHQISDEVRFVQLTPPGSGCSIHLGQGSVAMAPGSLEGVYLVVPDVHAARSHLVDRGVEVSEIQVFDAGSFRPGREGDNLDNVGFVFFSDPDGNRWGVQQIPARG
jgi:catechol 2,3-dioxygenase-like lactoylglutathione lyase family enzyme